MNDLGRFFAIPQWQGELSERAGGQRVAESFTAAWLFSCGQHIRGGKTSKVYGMGAWGEYTASCIG